MTEHKTMNTIIHAAFRRDLARFGAALDAFPACSRNRAERLHAAWENYNFQLHRHHEEEETIFFPALRELGAATTLLDQLEREHARMLAALTDANTAMRSLRANPTPGHVDTARRALSAARSAIETHLAHEERDLEPFSAAHASTPQLKAAQAAVRKSARGVAGTFFAWLLDGAAPTDIAALRRMIPPPALFVSSRFGGRRYRRTIATAWTIAPASSSPETDGSLRPPDSKERQAST